MSSEDNSPLLPPPPFEFEWEVADWRRLPRQSRDELVTELARLMGRLAYEEGADDHRSEDHPTST